MRLLKSVPWVRLGPPLAFTLLYVGAAQAEVGGVPLHGFADVGAAHASGGDPNLLRGFSVGNIDIYLAPQLGELRSLIELVFEVDAEGGIATDLERVQIGLPTGDRSVLWMGRFHTPYGHWNTAFHHGAQLQTSINRPRFLDFEDKGGMLPSHAVGIWWTGNKPIANDRINYNLYLANGDHIATSTESKVLSFNAARDDDNGKLVGGSLAYQRSDVEIGVHAYHDIVETYLHGDKDTRINRSVVIMAGGFLNYETDKWDVAFEWYHFSNETQHIALGAPGAEGSHDSNLWFAQVGRHLESWTPFVRIEQARIDSDDTYFSSMDSGQPYVRKAAGLNYTWNAHTAFKMELSHTQEKPNDHLDTRVGINTQSAGANLSYWRLQLQAAVSF